MSMGAPSGQDRWLASSASFAEELYRQWLDDPASVDAAWQAWFSALAQTPAAAEAPESPTRTVSPCGHETAAADSAFLEAVRSMTGFFQRQGVQHARLDPLGLQPVKPLPSWPVDPEALVQREHLPWPWRDLVPAPLPWSSLQAWLAERFCGTIGFETGHLQDETRRVWWMHQIAARGPRAGTVERDPVRSFERLVRATLFEQFLQTKYPSVKRFGLEGAESVLVALDHVRTLAHGAGMAHLVLGMAHRGRLNVLAHVLDRPYLELLAELRGLHSQEPAWWSGDVKYHAGYASIHREKDHALSVTLLPNPSHLESVNPVILGFARGLADSGVEERPGVLPVLVHGDASVAGQGVVYESLQMQDLAGYSTGGTLHVVINNQVGFTADPSECRSGVFCTDGMRGWDVPVLHVNGDDVCAVVKAAEMAFAFRQAFHKDVVIDLVCYRLHGHNELDEPAFTQPVMSQTIRDHPRVMEADRDRLVAGGQLSAARAEACLKTVRAELDKAFADAAALDHGLPRACPSHSPLYAVPVDDPVLDPGVPVITGVDQGVLVAVGKRACQWPGTLQVHPKIRRVMETRRAMLEGHEPTDWGTGEMLAFASLLDQGFSVRLAGQDSGRGTFSHRHAVLLDQENGSRYVPLRHTGAPGTFTVHNSLLSEFAAMGFEFGYSLACPRTLTLWEAQFGDFANGAQVIIDQYLSASQAKWGVVSGLVLLLPHGYEGQGPEHSSARLERFLQMASQHNWFVVNCTTPASFFHVLRRQMMMTTRRPLVVMTPKSLLRHKEAVSPLADYGAGTFFQPLLPDETADPARVTQVVLCSGRVFYDLVDERRKRDRTDTALVRLEQLYPFPVRAVQDLWSLYPGARWFWCQDEPQNMGAWRFVETAWYEETGPEAPPPLVYIGRAPAASPAAGLAGDHRHEQEQIMKHVFAYEDEASS